MDYDESIKERRKDEKELKGWFSNFSGWILNHTNDRDYIKIETKDGLGIKHTIWIKRKKDIIGISKVVVKTKDFTESDYSLDTIYKYYPHIAKIIVKNESKIKGEINKLNNDRIKDYQELLGLI